MKLGHNSRLYVVIYNVSDTEEKSKIHTCSPLPVSAFTTITNQLRISLPILIMAEGFYTLVTERITKRTNLTFVEI